MKEKSIFVSYDLQVMETLIMVLPKGNKVGGV